MTRIIPKISPSALLALSLFGCAHKQAVPELSPVALAPAAAQFQTTYGSKHEPHGGAAAGHEPRQVQWRMWRDENRIVTENLGARTGELWQRDGTAVFHQKIFHEDRRSIEYRTDDLVVTATDVAWPRRSLLVDPEVLSRLTLRRAGWKGDIPYRRYVGESSGSQWDITIRTDLMLPMSIVRTHEGVREQTVLQEAHALNNAPWPPTSSADYEVIDFADLGDRQADPFVAKVQGQLGQPPHVH